MSTQNRFCSSCGQATSQTARFCRSCGAEQVSISQTETSKKRQDDKIDYRPNRWMLGAYATGVLAVLAGVYSYIAASSLASWKHSHPDPSFRKDYDHLGAGHVSTNLALVGFFLFVPLLLLAAILILRYGAKENDSIKRAWFQSKRFNISLAVFFVLLGLMLVNFGISTFP